MHIDLSHFKKSTRYVYNNILILVSIKYTILHAYLICDSIFCHIDLTYLSSSKKNNVILNSTLHIYYYSDSEVCMTITHVEKCPVSFKRFRLFQNKNLFLITLLKKSNEACAFFFFFF